MLTASPISSRINFTAISLGEEQADITHNSSEISDNKEI